jgi:hypothetical protein
MQEMYMAGNTSSDLIDLKIENLYPENGFTVWIKNRTPKISRPSGKKGWI